YISTEIAAIPLLWVIPLGLYLLSFVLVFARLPALIHQIFVFLLPVVILLLIAVYMPQMRKHWTVGTRVALHLGAFFVAAMVCHGELARSRPPVAYLTEFYLWMATGGVLGGIFNALVAPQIFRWIAEYPTVIALACCLRPHFIYPSKREPTARAAG